MRRMTGGCRDILEIFWVAPAYQILDGLGRLIKTKERGLNWVF